MSMHAAKVAYWKAQDWRKTDTQLARELGRCQSVVLRARRRYGLPASPAKGKWRK